VPRRRRRARSDQHVPLAEESGEAAEQRRTLPLGPGEPARRGREPLLGVPDDIRLDEIAMRRELQFAIDHEMLRAQYEEHVFDRTELGERLLDDRARILEP